jgi:tight adherence protein B
VTLSTDDLGLLAVGLLAVGLAVALASLIAADGLGRRAFRRYAAGLDRQVRFCFLATSGRELATQQGVALGLVLLGALLLPDARWTYAIALIVAGPRLYLFLERRRRLKRIDEQIDGWLLMLANMLRATGSLAEAVQSTGDLIRAPLKQELDLVAKELKLGRPLDDALRAMAERIRLPNLSTVVTMILVARSTGGELPQLLETTAASLREMARLEGVLRSQTAQGKLQLAVLVLGPIAVVWGLRQVEPTYFDPLVDNVIGWFILGAAIALWIGSIVMARRILNVDY